MSMVALQIRQACRGDRLTQEEDERRKIFKIGHFWIAFGIFPQFLASRVDYQLKPRTSR